MSIPSSNEKGPRSIVYGWFNQEKQNKIEIIIPNYKLNINESVRRIELKKARYNVSPYYYTISDIWASSLQSVLLMTLLRESLDPKNSLLKQLHKYKKLNQ
jgi:hypothetical protein